MSYQPKLIIKLIIKFLLDVELVFNYLCIHTITDYDLVLSVSDNNAGHWDSTFRLRHHSDGSGGLAVYCVLFSGLRLW